MANEPLNTEVKGNAESCRAVAKWLTDLSEAVHQSGTALYRARSESESVWTGQAADAFRDSIAPKAKDADELSERCASLATGLTTFAGTLETAQRLMQQARSVAAGAGLEVTPTQINPPNTSAVVPNREAPTPAAKDQYFAAFNDQQNKIKAFDEVSGTVDEARERERDAHRELEGVIKKKSFFESYGTTVASAVASTGGAVHGQLKVLQEKTGQYNKAIESTKSMYSEATSFGERQGAVSRLAALRKGLYDTQQQAARTKIVSYPLGGPLAHPSPGDIEKGAEKITRVGRAGRVFPYLGTALTGYTAVKNISEGKPAAKEVEKAGGGLLASVGTGAAAGACIGGPVGAAVGAVGGAAVSYGLGKFIDWKGGPVEQFNRSVGIE